MPLIDKKVKKFHTIDSLIKALEEARKKLNCDAEVLLYHGDGAYEGLEFSDVYPEIIEATKIYPEEKNLTIKVGEDSGLFG